MGFNGFFQPKHFPRALDTCLLHIAPLSKKKETNKKEKIFILTATKFKARIFVTFVNILKNCTFIKK